MRTTPPPAHPPSPSLEITEPALTQGELDPLIIASNWPSHTVTQLTAVISSPKDATDSLSTLETRILSG